MSRIENFIPHLKKHKVQTRGEVTLLEFENDKAIPIENDVVSFIKQVNGHLSLKEIFMFLNKKAEFFSIEKSLIMLRYLANNKLLINFEDYFKINAKNSGVQPKKMQSEFNQAYFSEERLIGLLQKTTLFLECDRNTARSILHEATLENYKVNSVIIKTGSKSPYFYVVLSGEVGVYWKEECLANLGSLSVFGESAAVFDRVRNADVIASQDSWVLKVDATKIVDTKSPDSFDSFKGLKSRLILNQTLAANPLFQSLPNDTLQLFISKCRIEKWGKEQTVIEQDSSSGDFYLILKGSVAVVKDGMPVTSLKEGDHFGEVAAIFNEPRTATILTETACTFVVLNQKSLFEVLSSHFRLAIDIEKTARSRWKSSGNILDIFEESFQSDSPRTNEDSLVSVLSSEFQVDEDFLEITQSHFELEILDRTDPKNKAS